VIVGVNRWRSDTTDTAAAIELQRIDPEAERRQVERLAEVRAGRDGDRVRAALGAVGDAARGDGELLPPIREALAAYATVGEVCGVLRDAWGTYDAVRRHP
jgi:methylmalonyl-CoA mutase, N-terminal domain